ncbi:hypothetical protein AVEN_200038-1 [Araneus ventricosus]|uniref:Uncharacterized protein n=1 Tax=Araneus ventricosus TaxID=182803 RepID=A0A4Y2NSX2_ARAVE|nr:hypothetical protein AVEN_200038-1 [Araneus ventricosus]
MCHPSNGSTRTTNTWGFSSVHEKQTERRQLLMESFLAYPRGKEESKNLKGRGKKELDKTLGYLGVVNAVTPEDVPLRGEEFADLHLLLEASVPAEA